MKACSKSSLKVGEKMKKFEEKFNDVFADPIELSPFRRVFDRRIALEKGEKLVNMRPYRYPLKQRDIIEHLVQEMLDRGITQHSASPFAIPVVLVGRKDDTWML